jgi:hypothetical protein
MKNKLILIFLMLTVVISCGDPIFTSKYYIKNNTNITLYVYSTFNPNYSFDIESIEKATIDPNKTIDYFTDGGLGLGRSPSDVFTSITIYNSITNEIWLFWLSSGTKNQNQAHRNGIVLPS